MGIVQDYRKQWVQANLLDDLSKEKKAELRAEFNTLRESKKGRTKVAQTILPEGTAEERFELKQAIKPKPKVTSTTPSSTITAPVGPILGPPYPGPGGFKYPPGQKPPTAAPTTQTTSTTPKGPSQWYDDQGWYDRNTRFIPGVRLLDEAGEEFSKGNIVGGLANTGYAVTEGIAAAALLRGGKVRAATALAASKPSLGGYLSAAKSILNPKAIIMDIIHPIRGITGKTPSEIAAAVKGTSLPAGAPRTTASVPRTGATGPSKSALVSRGTKTATTKSATTKSATTKTATTKSKTSTTKSKTSTKKPDAKKPDAKKPDAKKPDAKKPDAKKPAAKKPATKKPATKKPAVVEVPPRPPDPMSLKPADMNIIDFQKTEVFKKANQALIDWITKYG